MKRKEVKIPEARLAKLRATQDNADAGFEERRVHAQVRAYVEWRIRAGHAGPVTVYPGTLGAMNRDTSKGATARALSTATTCSPARASGSPP
jgi:hypothetical protein